jgi:nitroreductase/FMN reductase [NAD(P)H]
MNSDRAARRALTSALAERFGENMPLPEDLAGIETLAAIASHRTGRSYEARPIEPELVRLIAACSLSAPSKSDLQQADIIEVADGQKRAAIAAMIPSMPWVRDAAAFLVVCGNGRRLLEASRIAGELFANQHLDHFFNAAVDAALVLQNLIVCAEAVGLATCPISVIRNHAAKVSGLLDLPDYVFPVAGLCLGWPAGERHLSPRLPLSQTLHRDRYTEGELAEALAAYDRRRARAEGKDPDHPEFVGWSRAKARMYAEPQRADFGAFITGKGFRLD